MCYHIHRCYEIHTDRSITVDSLEHDKGRQMQKKNSQWHGIRFNIGIVQSSIIISSDFAKQNIFIYLKKSKMAGWLENHHFSQEIHLTFMVGFPVILVCGVLGV